MRSQVFSALPDSIGTSVQSGDSDGMCSAQSITEEIKRANAMFPREAVSCSGMETCAPEMMEEQRPWLSSAEEMQREELPMWGLNE